jgi:RNA polymerase sigma-70 factor (ECF subfamily)
MLQSLKQRLPQGSPASPHLTPSVQRLLDGYVSSWERGDLDALVALLTENVVLSMPPMPEWFCGRPSVRASSSGRGAPTGRVPFVWCRSVRTHSQHLACMVGQRTANTFTAQAIQVLTLVRGRIARVHGFVRPDLFMVLGLPLRLPA